MVDNRSRAIDNDGKPFAVGAFDLGRNQAGHNPVELCWVVGCRPRECFVSAEVLVSEWECFTGGARELICRPLPPSAILAMLLVNSVAPSSILFY